MTNRSISLTASVAVIAILVVVTVGGLYLADTISTNTTSASPSSPGIGSTLSNDLTTSTQTGPITITSCSPGPCASNSQRMTTINGSTFVVINGTATESVICTVEVPSPQGIYLRIVTDNSDAPVSGVQVTAHSTPTASCDSKNVHLSDSEAITNSSGWIFFQEGYLYYLVFNYSGHAYNFSVPSQPMAWSAATISVPSGRLSTDVCEILYSYDCRTISQSQDASWLFTMVANYTQGIVTKGNDIEISASLAYVATDNETLCYVSPLLAGLQVLNETGSVVWAFQPPALTNCNQTIIYQRSFSETLDISTASSGFLSGQKYSISFGPILYDQHGQRIGQDLQVSLDFSLV